MSTEFAFAGALELARLIRAKEASATELTRLFIESSSASSAWMAL